MNKDIKKIEEILAKFSMEDGAFLSTWNEKTGEYTVSFEGDDLLNELTTLLQDSERETFKVIHGMLVDVLIHAGERPSTIQGLEEYGYVKGVSSVTTMIRKIMDKVEEYLKERGKDE